MLDAPGRRSQAGGHRRALVHDGQDGLTINFNGDYPGGVTVGRDLTVTGRIRWELPSGTESLLEVVLRLKHQVAELRRFDARASTPESWMRTGASTRTSTSTLPQHRSASGQSCWSTGAGTGAQGAEVVIPLANCYLSEAITPPHTREVAGSIPALPIEGLT